MYKLSIISKRKQVVIYLLGLKATYYPSAGYMRIDRVQDNSAPVKFGTNGKSKLGTC